MYCKNCGNELPEDAYVCIKCGILTNKEEVIEKKEGDSLGILSIVFSSIAVLIALNMLSEDIIMYSKVLDKIVYIISSTGLALALTLVSSILGFTNKKKICNKIGLSLSLLSLFFILTKVIVIILY